MKSNVRKMGFNKFSAKVIGLAIVIFCVSLSLLVPLLIKREAIFLEENFIRRGQDMLTGVGEASRVAILGEDADRLEMTASESMKHRQEILYIIFYRFDWKQIYTATANVQLQNTLQVAPKEYQRFVAQKKSDWQDKIFTRNKLTKENIPVSEFWTTISHSEVGELEMVADQSLQPVRPGSTKVSGYICMGVSRSELDTIIGRITQDSIIAGLLTLIFMSIATAWLLRRLMSPFSELVMGVQAVAEGDMERTITVKSIDEVGRLAKEFNKMVVALKERQQMLSQSEYKFRSLFERIHSGILIFDKSGDILDSNPAMVKMVGFEDLQTLTSVPMKDIFKNHQDCEMLIQRIQTKCYIPDLQLILINKKTNKDVHTNVSITCQRDVDGRYEYSEAFFVDITHITELEKRLLHAHKMEAVGTLAGGIAHDFNNILTVLAGRIGLIASTPAVKNDEKLNESIQEMEQSVTRAGNLVSQILGFARKGMYKEDLMDLNKVVREAHSLLGETIDRRIEIKLDLAPEIWLIRGDESQIFQSLLNLCLNGCDAMPDGGRLTIKTGTLINKENLPMIDDVMPPDSYVFIEVKDTGCGIDEKMISKVFDPFFTTKEVGKGTGLGMAMVHGIVSNHNGYLNLESQEEKGTAITIYFSAILEEGLHRSIPGKDPQRKIDNTLTRFPEREKNLPEEKIFEKEPLMRRDQKSVDGAVEESKAREGNATTVLLVDDEEKILRVNTLFFSPLDDYILLTASSGEESIEILKSGKVNVDIVVMDISMPGMGGEKAFRIIHELFPDLPVIIATGHAHDETVNSILEGGAADLMLKPYLGGGLLEVIKKHCHKRGK